MARFPRAQFRHLIVAMFDELRILLNFEMDSKDPLLLILVGQVQLLAKLALRNCEIRQRGRRDRPLRVCDLQADQWQTLLLFPAADAVTLTPRLVAADPRPVMHTAPPLAPADPAWRRAHKKMIKYFTLPAP